MSEVVTLTSGASDTMYGTFALGTAYLAFLTGSRGDTFRALDTDGQKRAFVEARRALDALAWDPTTAGSLAARDAIPAFVNASYELAAFVAEDLSQLAGGDGVIGVAGGGVSVTFDPQVVRNTGVLPDTVLALVAAYLKSPSATGYAETGSDCPAFGEDAEYRRRRPF